MAMAITDAQLASCLAYYPHQVEFKMRQTKRSWLIGIP